MWFYIRRKHILSGLIFACGFFVICSLEAQFAGGQGNENDPWQIATPAHLDNVRNYLGEAHSDKHFIQTANINLGIAPYNEGQGWQPIGFHIAWNNYGYFYGKYNGNGFTVNNLTINRNSDYQGLFGYIDQGVVHSVSLDSVNVSGRQFVGAIAGRNSGVISNSSATGIIRGGANSNYIGGLVGYNYIGVISNSWANVAVSGEGSNLGGLVGQNTVVSRILNCYAVGSVTGTTNVGGLVGQNRSLIANSYSIGLVSGEQNVGGLVGTQTQAEVNNSYWNMETSQQENSASGTGLTTVQMLDQDSYEDWDFEDVWQMVPEITYPYLAIQEEPADHNYPYGRVRPNPLPACTPSPPDDTTNVDVDIECLSWNYLPNVLHHNPLGFRVYMNTTGEFGEDDDFVWVDYEDNQIEYQCADILPEQLDYFTRYYWMVIPTTIDPNDDRNDGRIKRRENSTGRIAMNNRGDAENCSVWSFRTQLRPYPEPAINPNPVDDSTGVSVYLERLSWQYVVDTTSVLPVGFRVYMNKTGDFSEEEVYDWIPYTDEQTEYSSIHILPMRLHYGTKHYWQVVPTTIDPDDDRRGEYHSPESRRRQSAIGRLVFAVTRGDAENCPVWSFKTEEPHPNPLPAVNPRPKDEMIDVSVNIDTLYWEYEADPAYLNPSGFRIYLNTTGDFSEEDTFDWVPFVADQEKYFSIALLTDLLEYGTQYFWTVIPTTISPERTRESSNLKTSYPKQERGDAEDCPVWSFSTESGTYIHEEDINAKATKLYPNYPNPFNPQTTIGFYVAETSFVSLKIYNSRGQKLFTALENQQVEQGYHSYVWNCKDNTNKYLGSGVYFYIFNSRSISGESHSQRKKMIILK